MLETRHGAKLVEVHTRALKFINKNHKTPRLSNRDIALGFGEAARGVRSPKDDDSFL